MSETVDCTFYNPLTGEKTTVSVDDEEYASQGIPQDETYGGLQVQRRNPSYDDVSWFTLTWTMMRVDGDATSIEDAAELALSCPECGDACTVQFDGDEFEDLVLCDSCELYVTRDQPTESGQADVINYAINIDSL